MAKIITENPIIIYVGLIVAGAILLVAGISLVVKTLFKKKNRRPFISDLRNEIRSGVESVKAGKETLSNALDTHRVFKNEIRNNMMIILSENEKLKSRLDENESTMDNLRKEFEIITKENNALKEKLDKYPKESKETQIVDFKTRPEDIKIWEDEIGSVKDELSNIKNKIIEHRKISQDIKRQIAEITEGIPNQNE